MFCDLRFAGGLATCVREGCGRSAKTNKTSAAAFQMTCRVSSQPAGQGSVAAVSIAPILNECIHRGPQLTVAAAPAAGGLAGSDSPTNPPALRFEQCRICGGQDRIVPIHACTVFGECSVAKFSSRQTMACCWGCKSAKTGVVGETGAAADESTPLAGG